MAISKAKDVVRSRPAIRRLTQLGMMALLASGSLAAGTIGFQTVATNTTSGGNPVYLETFTIAGFNLTDNSQVFDVLDIQFSQAQFGQLVNGVAGPGFNVLLLQPNNPPGEHGDYNLIPTVNDPAFNGTFSVDFTWTGPGSPLTVGSEPFVVQQFSTTSGDLVSGACDQPGGACSGIATNASISAIPEPATWLLMVAGIVVAGSFGVSVRRPAAAVQS